MDKDRCFCDNQHRIKDDQKHNGCPDGNRVLRIVKKRITYSDQEVMDIRNGRRGLIKKRQYKKQEEEKEDKINEST
jgi:6-phosphofructokinase